MELKSLLQQGCYAHSSEVSLNSSTFSHLSSISPLPSLPNCWCAEVHCEGVDSEASELRAGGRHSSSQQILLFYYY